MTTTKTSRLDPSNWSKGAGAQANLFGALGFKQPAPYPQLSVGDMVQAASSGGTPPGAGGTVGAEVAQGAEIAAGNGCTAAQNAANKALAQQLAASYGWSTGTQWTDLNNIVMAESGWCNTAQNPGSSAYGIGQFLSGTWATVGGTKTSNPTTQIKLLLIYIKMRYGTPSKAWAFHEANGYY